MALYACHAYTMEVCRTKDQFLQWFGDNHEKLGIYDAIEQDSFHPYNETFVDRFSTDGDSERVMEGHLLNPTDKIIKAALKADKLKQTGDSFSKDNTIVEAIFQYELDGSEVAVEDLIFVGQEGSADQHVHANRKHLAIRGTISQFHKAAQESEHGLLGNWLSAPSEEDLEESLKEECEALGLTLIACHGMKKQKKPMRAAGSHSRKR